MADEPRIDPEVGELPTVLSIDKGRRKTVGGGTKWGECRVEPHEVISGLVTTCAELLERRPNPMPTLGFNLGNGDIVVDWTDSEDPPTDRHGDRLDIFIRPLELADRPRKHYRLAIVAEVGRQIRTFQYWHIPYAWMGDRTEGTINQLRSSDKYDFGEPTAVPDDEDDDLTNPDTF